jgi:hypothetical protein
MKNQSFGIFSIVYLEKTNITTFLNHIKNFQKFKILIKNKIRSQGWDFKKIRIYAVRFSYKQYRNCTAVWRRIKVTSSGIEFLMRVVLNSGRLRPSHRVTKRLSKRTKINSKRYKYLLYLYRYRNNKTFYVLNASPYHYYRHFWCQLIAVKSLIDITKSNDQL